MLHTGDWLHPHLNRERAHYAKPPLTYWAAAAGLEIFGRNAWGARFSNAVAFFLTTLAVSAIGSRLWDRRTGFIAGLVYLSSPLPALAAGFLTTDTLLTLWQVVAVLAFVSWWRAGSPIRAASRWWIRAMWFSFGVAFFTKGPPALLPPCPEQHRGAP